jgi:hypothetical protein
LAYKELTEISNIKKENFDYLIDNLNRVDIES